MAEHHLLSTVWHSGTTYFRDVLQKRLPSLEVHHCEPSVISRAEVADCIWTTWREPVHVAASWANRGRNTEEFYQRWCSQWESYAELLTFNPIVLDFTKGREQAGFTFGPVPLNQHADDLRVHHAAHEGDWETYYRHVPRNFITFIERLDLRRTTVNVR